MTITAIRPASPEDAYATPAEPDVSATTTDRCYLPWCDDCGYDNRSIVNGDFGNCHFGAAAERDVRGIYLKSRTTIKVELERADWDGDDCEYAPTTGETLVYMNVAIDGCYSDGQSMTFEEAEQVGWNLITRARVGRMYAKLANPNRVSAEDVAAAIAREEIKQARRDAENSPATAINPKVEPPKRRRYDWAGRLYQTANDLAESSLGRFPRTVTATAHVIFHGSRRIVFDLGFRAGLFHSRRISLIEYTGHA
jgi:hypothetical protein